ncbi:hypothetical protein ADK59_25705 [Streptomyces sp. XY332]|nr:hypothetical protein ADK59_25705 [Streptomyces sp. XY332]
MEQAVVGSGPGQGQSRRAGAEQVEVRHARHTAVRVPARRHRGHTALDQQMGGGELLDGWQGQQGEAGSGGLLLVTR